MNNDVGKPSEAFWGLVFVIIISWCVATALTGCGNVTAVDDPTLAMRGATDSRIDGQQPPDSSVGGAAGTMANGFGGSGSGGALGVGGAVVNPTPVTETINVSTWITFSTNPPGTRGILHACLYDNDLWGTRERNTVCAWKYGVDGNADQVPQEQVVSRWDSPAVVDLSGHNASTPFQFSFNINAVLSKDYLLIISQGGTDNPSGYCGKMPLDVTHATPFVAVELNFMQSGEININQALVGYNVLSRSNGPIFTTECDHTQCKDPCGCPGPNRDPACMSGGGL